jgi:hypothetical protein
MADKATIDCTAQTTAIEPLTGAELAQQAADQAADVDHQWATMRTDRNARLVACDWVAVPDTPLPEEQVTAWHTYRQQLRDLPETTTDPAVPDWPEPPAG